jgi:uncharacterized membrane protein YphA (DoxX/SURF4 family)
MAHSIGREPARPFAAGEVSNQAGNPIYQAYQILHWGFVAAPVIAGLDKFFHLLTHWEQYLAPIIPQTLGLAPQTIMHIAGVLEIVAGILVAVKPRIGAYVVAVWLLGIIINLLIYPGFFDIALRDFGLLLGALALARLSQGFERA